MLFITYLYFYLKTELLCTAYGRDCVITVFHWIIRSHQS